MKKQVSSSTAWHLVSAELSGEELKVASYDKVILNNVGHAEGMRWLDYGSGPGVFAAACKELGIDIHAWDINPSMRKECGNVIGHERIFQTLSSMRRQLFDVITCNLVVCIITEEAVRDIAKRIRRLLRKDGTAYIGFCNPQIYDVSETQLDIRFPTGEDYWTHHRIPKIKKEGNYRIFDEMRPISWYHDVFKQSGLEQVGLHTTAPYRMPGNERTIRDFIIFEQTRV